MKRDAQVKGMLNVIENIYNTEKTEPYLIVTGDLNATRYSSPLQILEKAGLKILNYREKQDEFYTYIYKKEKQDLDYIIVNQKLDKAMKRAKLQAIHDKMVTDVSDHYPIILKFDL
jgi:predicted extracellular nuclease